MDVNRYAQLTEDGMIKTRSSVFRSWDEVFGWTAEEARDLGARMIELADQADRASEAVQELAQALAGCDEPNGDSDDWEDLAFELVKKGYHK